MSQYFLLLPKELRILVDRYRYYSNICLLNKIYKKLTLTHFCTLDCVLSKGSNTTEFVDINEQVKAEREIPLLLNSLKPFKLNIYIIRKYISTEYNEHFRQSLLQIHHENIVSDELLFEIFQDPTFVNYVEKRIKTDCKLFPGRIQHSLIVKLNKLLRHHRYQIYVHYISTEEVKLLFVKK
jgi:hypothetical protein